MMIPAAVSPGELNRKMERMWDLSARKIRSLERSAPALEGAPVFTAGGAWTSRGWTEWTQGFQYGSALLQFEATGDQEFLDIGRENTLQKMAVHLTHFGVHDHGFNNVSTYGTLLRLLAAGVIPENPWERHLYELALKVSGAVQARRWTSIPGGGFIYSFNGPHSLFVDTIRSLRALAVSHHLGHVLREENDRSVSLLERLVQHARATARWSVYYGEGRDGYDVYGRVAHESIFNTVDGAYRCASTQQGYSPFSTWTRGLAWAILGFAEQLEFLSSLAEKELAPLGGRREILAVLSRAARATSDFYIENTAADGIPYWDTGAPGLPRLGPWRERPAEPDNAFEPVDSSAAAIACQGLLRYGTWLRGSAPAVDAPEAERYVNAGLGVLSRLLEEPYLGTAENHQGLLLHSIYHRPNGWDAVPAGHAVPSGESSMWGDYHLREAALHAQRFLEGGRSLVFWAERR
jgi:unsaturated chondroitin disaccharide hydrolase